ncbi:hypothetical protein HDC92_001335 [Pedobacter sp. AK017]|uniref:DUF3037 domain-containing protein n=1 Tax=Pedobacter sp. AK017 TaxID=2723073 RepID=UPI00161E7C0E|nr:DUF3037 domain-containing protein [Pedobacter sp. AK017]MBB5437663.1 hypothetical protein [Pedobacter sp. AK017]
MQEKHLFEYAVIRVVPRVEREEFMNVGVVVYCPKQKFLQVMFELNLKKLNIFCTDLDVSVLEENLNAFKRICIGGSDAGTIGKLDIASRFRWLTATRSTVLQTSRAHAGLSADAHETLHKLYNKLVR